VRSRRAGVETHSRLEAHYTVRFPNDNTTAVDTSRAYHLLADARPIRSALLKIRDPTCHEATYVIGGVASESRRAAIAETAGRGTHLRVCRLGAQGRCCRGPPVRRRSNSLQTRSSSNTPYLCGSHRRCRCTGVSRKRVHYEQLLTLEPPVTARQANGVPGPEFCCEQAMKLPSWPHAGVLGDQRVIWQLSNGLAAQGLGRPPVEPPKTLCATPSQL
jgi:hypothetical protein